MAVLVANPEADPAVTAGDGYLTQVAMIPDTWANLRAGTPGLGMKTADNAGITLNIDTVPNLPNWDSFSRAIACFDTSALTAGATVTGVTLHLYVEAFTTTKVLTEGLSITQATPAAYNTLVDVDYVEFTDTKLAADIPFGSIGQPAYNMFTFNAAGIAWINKVGVTAIGIRTLAETDNVEANADLTRITITSADAGANPPVLTVTYTLGGGTNYEYLITKQFKPTTTVVGEEPFDL